MISWANLMNEIIMCNKLAKSGERGTGWETGGVTPAVGQLALLQLPDQLLWCRAPASTRRQTLGEELQGGGEIPHLDGAVVVTGQDEPPGPGAHPAAPITLVNTETCDDGPGTNCHSGINIPGQLVLKGQLILTSFKSPPPSSQICCKNCKLEFETYQTHWKAFISHFDEKK